MKVHLLEAVGNGHMPVHTLGVWYDQGIEEAKQI